VGATPSTRNFGVNLPCLSEIADFEPILAGSVSALTPSEKSSKFSQRAGFMRTHASTCSSAYVCIGYVPW